MRTSTSAAEAVVAANPAATARAVKVRRKILDILLFLMLRALWLWLGGWDKDLVVKEKIQAAAGGEVMSRRPDVSN